MEKNNKVIIKVGGGLGNQLFCYAIYRFWELKGINVYFDIKDPYVNRIYIKISEANSIFRLQEYFPNSQIKLINNYDYEDEYYEEPWDRFEFFEKINAKANLLIQKGWFFLYKPAYTIRDLLIKELAFTKKLPECVEELLSNINNTHSVSIHVRRGDYIMPQYYYKVGYVCTLDYYKNTYDYMIEQYSDLEFFVFTNDPEWVRVNFDFIGNYNIIDTSNFDLSSYYDLFLMSKCKHNIIANSTFSWWAAFFNQNNHKIVITPLEFENQYITIDDICPPDWIRVSSMRQQFFKNEYIY